MFAACSSIFTAFFLSRRYENISLNFFTSFSSLPAQRASMKVLWRLDGRGNGDERSEEQEMMMIEELVVSSAKLRTEHHRRFAPRACRRAHLYLARSFS